MGLPVSIDSMKSTINRHGGIARGNRYVVYITHPLKGKEASPITAAGPFDYLQNEAKQIPNNKSKKEEHKFAEYIQDGRDTHMLCTNVTLPGKLIATTEAKHDHNLAKKPYSMQTDEVTTTFLLTNDYYMKKYFDTWMELIVDSTGNHYKTMYKEEYCRDVEIQALYGNDSHQVGYGCKLENAYPRQISQVELGNDQESLMSVTITWEYDNWRLTGAEDGMEQIESEPAIPAGEPKVQEMPELESAIPDGEPRKQDISSSAQGGPPDFATKPAIPFGEPKGQHMRPLQPAIPHGQPRAQNRTATGPAGQSASESPAIPFGEPKGQRIPRQEPAISHGLPRGQRIPKLGSAIPHGLPAPQKRRFTWSFKI